MKPLPPHNRGPGVKEVLGLNQEVRDQTDYLRLDQMKDEEIDYSDSPETDAAFWQGAQVADSGLKKAISLRVDAEVLGWFKERGGRYQYLMN